MCGGGWGCVLSGFISAQYVLAAADGSTLIEALSAKISHYLSYTHAQKHTNACVMFTGLRTNMPIVCLLMKAENQIKDIKNTYNK